MKIDQVYSEKCLWYVTYQKNFFFNFVLNKTFKLKNKKVFYKLDKKLKIVLF